MKRILVISIFYFLFIGCSTDESINESLQPDPQGQTIEEELNQRNTSATIREERISGNRTDIVVTKPACGSRFNWKGGTIVYTVTVYYPFGNVRTFNHTDYVGGFAANTVETYRRLRFYKDLGSPVRKDVAMVVTLIDGCGSTQTRFSTSIIYD